MQIDIAIPSVSKCYISVHVFCVDLRHVASHTIMSIVIKYV